MMTIFDDTTRIQLLRPLALKGETERKFCPNQNLPNLGAFGGHRY